MKFDGKFQGATKIKWLRCLHKWRCSDSRVKMQYIRCNTLQHTATDAVVHIGAPWTDLCVKCMCRNQIIYRIQTFTIQIGCGPPEPIYMWNVCVGLLCVSGVVVGGGCWVWLLGVVVSILNAIYILHHTQSESYTFGSYIGFRLGVLVWIPTQYTLNDTKSESYWTCMYAQTESYKWILYPIRILYI